MTNYERIKKTIKEKNLEGIYPDNLFVILAPTFEEVKESFPKNDLKSVFTEMQKMVSEVELSRKERLIVKLVFEENLDVKEVSHLLNVKPETIEKHFRNAMRKLKQPFWSYRIPRLEYPYNLIRSVIGNERWKEWKDSIPSDVLTSIVDEVMKTKLTQIETEVLILRFKEKKTLEGVAEQIGVTRERVRHIQARAIRRMWRLLFELLKEQAEE